MNELLRQLLNLPPQGSSIARDIDTLHYAVIGTTMLGVAVVGLVATVFVIRYRARGAPPAVTPRVVASPRVELAVFGGLLALFCTWWVIGFLQYRDLETPPADAMPIYVTAKQWMWEFAYPTGPTSTDVLVVPVDRPVKLVLTSRDVLHGFYVPAFRIKQDVVPGRAVTAWFTATETGTYDVLCTQYCGTRHSFMRGTVVVLAPGDYARWLDAARAPLALPGAKGDGQGLADRGRAVAAARGCLRCHTLDGSPFIGPTWAGSFGRRRAITGGGDVLIDEAYLTQSMMDPAAVIAAGFRPVMPSYQGVVSPDEVAAIVELIRSLRDVHVDHPVPAPAAQVVYP